MKLARLPVFVVLENVRSLYNVGSAFRTSDGVDINKLYLTGFTGYPPRSEITKTALGAEAVVPWEHVARTTEVIKKLRRDNIKIIGVEKTDTSISYTDYRFEFPSALIFGNEIMGVSRETLADCDAVVHIPMRGTKESLNVATAYGVVLYECLRQHQNTK
jgi:23S rRNA (guanosine2251-2'-O)-methyltransferase